MDGHPHQSGTSPDCTHTRSASGLRNKHGVAIVADIKTSVDRLSEYKQLFGVPDAETL